MKEKLESAIELLDIPGGVILALFSLTILGMCIAAFVLGKEIPASVKEIFQWILTTFAASKTLKTLFGKVVADTAPGKPDSSQSSGNPG